MERCAAQLRPLAAIRQGARRRTGVHQDLASRHEAASTWVQPFIGFACRFRARTIAARHESFVNFGCQGYNRRARLELTVEELRQIVEASWASGVSEEPVSSIWRGRRNRPRRAAS
jgi:hypothetical protein